MYIVKKMILATIFLLMSSAGFTQQPMYYYPSPKFKLPELFNSNNYYDFATGSAPPLSYLDISEVRSETYPEGEKIEGNQYETQKHHSGKYVFVTTVELGYGINPIITMNGQKVPLSSVVRKMFLCVSPSGKIRICNVGETIVGFSYIWDVTRFGNGEFTFIEFESDSSTKMFKRTIYIH